MVKPRVCYDNLNIGDKLFCVFTANIHEITRPVTCKSPTNMCFRLSDSSEITIEDLLICHDGRAYLYGFVKLTKEDS